MKVILTIMLADVDDDELEAYIINENVPARYDDWRSELISRLLLALLARCLF